MATPVPFLRRKVHGQVLIVLLVIPLLVGGRISPATAQLVSAGFPSLETVPDARSVGLGRAFTAIADGPSAVWWNPGALGMPAPWSAQVVTDVAHGSWIGMDELGVYAVSAQLCGVGVAAHLITMEEANAEAIISRVKRDALFHFGVGTDLAGRMRLGSPQRVRWGVGAAVKRYSVSYQDVARQLPKLKDGAAIDADAGSLLVIRVPLGHDDDSDLFALRGPSAPFAGLRAGAVLRDAFGTKIDVTANPGGTTSLGRQMRAGVALEAGTASWKRLGPVVAATVSAEMIGSIEYDRGSPARCVGVEMRILDILSLRYGQTRDDGLDLEGISRGAGIRMGLPGRAGIRLDWAQASGPHYLYRPLLRGRDRDLRQFSGSIWYQP